MSLIIGLNTPECIVVSADSRTTHKESDGTTSYKDNTEKIITFGNNIIAFCGDHFINSSKKQTVKTFLEKLCKKHEKENVCVLSSLILNEFYKYNDINVDLIIAGYYEFIPYIYTLNTKDKILKLPYSDSNFGATFIGQWQIVKSASENIKFNDIDLPTAIDLAKDWVDITTLMYKYKTNQCVGGPTDVCCVSPTGVPIWKYKK